MNSIKLVIIAIGLSITALAQVDREQVCIDQARTIEQKLSCIRGLAFKEVARPEGSNARAFELGFPQPVDHSRPLAGAFVQRIVLLHRSEAEPMILQTSGYLIFKVAESHVTRLFGTNQIQVEHRYFANSKPNPVNWAHLNVQQSAADFHNITVLFKKIYKGRWVNTGASKGGMTSVYHRRFYPDDLDGTLADVAPLSFAKDDPRYIQFVEQVGGQKFQACRQALKQIQISILKNKNVILPKIKGTFSQLGSNEVALEHAVSEMPFTYWQYLSPVDPNIGCHKIPVNGSIEEQYQFLENVNGPAGYQDENITPFQPYYFQSASQLGGPGTDRSYLKGLVRFPFSVDQYAPKGVPYTYSNALMKDVNSWVRNYSSKMLFVYGELDPWSAAMHPLNQDAKERYKFVVPGGNHSSTFMALPPSQKAAAIRILSGWLNKKPVSVGRSPVPSLELIEAQYRRHFRL